MRHKSTIRTPSAQDRPRIGAHGSLDWRLWSRIEKTESCWLWTGHVVESGYGKIMYQGKDQPVHRLVYTLLVGPIPDGKQLDHLCRVRHCCNPAHLEPVAARENILRGCGPTAQLAKQTHCKRGHEFTAQNTYLSAKGNRQCRACITRRYKPHPLPPRTHCKYGHILAGENAQVLASGRVRCRTCAQDATKRWRMRGATNQHQGRQGSRNGASRLTEDAVRTILHAVAMGSKQVDLARQFRVSTTTISRIVKRQAWTHVEDK